MNNLPLAPPPVLHSRKEHPIPKIGQPMTTNIDDLKPGRKYSYKRVLNNGDVRNYEGIYKSQRYDNKNRPLYLFDEIHYVGDGINMYLGHNEYFSGNYPTDFVEIPKLTVESLKGTKRVEPVSRSRVPHGGKSRKTKNRKSKKRTNKRRRGTRKH